MKEKRKMFLNIVIIFIIITMVVSVSNISNATQISETEKSEILEFIKNNEIFSYYNYSKIEDICITKEMLSEIGGKKVAQDQRQNTEIYEMIGDLDEGSVITKEAINKYLQNTIGVTVEKLKNYEQLLNQATTSNNKNEYYYLAITGQVNYSDYEITKIEKTQKGTIKVEITAKADEEPFSNAIELIKKEDKYNFVSSTSLDNKNRTVTLEPDKNEFNKKQIKDTLAKEDKTVATNKIPQTGTNENIIIISITIIALAAITILVIYRKIRKIK